MRTSRPPMTLDPSLGKSLYRKLDDYLHGEFFWKLRSRVFHPRLEGKLMDKFADRFKAQLESPLIARGRSLSGRLKEDLFLERNPLPIRGTSNETPRG